MQTRIRLHTVQGALLLAAFGLAPGVAAIALAAPHGQTEAMVVQEPQHPQPKPDAQQPVDPAQPNPQATKSTTFTGTILKSGSGFVLRDTAGTVYQLDAQEKAEPFEGKSVKVTGKLEETARLIHVEEIEAMSA